MTEHEQTVADLRKEINAMLDLYEQDPKRHLILLGVCAGSAEGEDSPGLTFSDASISVQAALLAETIKPGGPFAEVMEQYLKFIIQRAIQSGQLLRPAASDAVN